MESRAPLRLQLLRRLAGNADAEVDVRVGVRRRDVILEVGLVHPHLKHQRVL